MLKVDQSNAQIVDDGVPADEHSQGDAGDGRDRESSSDAFQAHENINAPRPRIPCEGLARTKDPIPPRNSNADRRGQRGARHPAGCGDGFPGDQDRGGQRRSARKAPEPLPRPFLKLLSVRPGYESHGLRQRTLRHVVQRRTSFWAAGGVPVSSVRVLPVAATRGPKSTMPATLSETSDFV